MEILNCIVNVAQLDIYRVARPEKAEENPPPPSSQKTKLNNAKASNVGDQSMIVI